MTLFIYFRLLILLFKIVDERHQVEKEDMFAEHIRINASTNEIPVDNPVIVSSDVYFHPFADPVVSNINSAVVVIG